MGRFLSLILAIEAIFMLPAFLISFFGKEERSAAAFLFSMGIILLIAGLLALLCRKATRDFYAREGLICVGACWILMSVLGCLPFVLSGAIPNYIDALFEMEPKRTVKIQPTEQKSGNKTPGNITIPAQDLDPMLRSNYSFDNFIEGLSNKLPRAAAESIAQKPGKTVFNPLFLYGASGVGKTHLANAIGLKVKELYPEKRVLYVSAHLFKVQYTDSVRKNTLNDFINFYQSIDVLIIDDIQEFVGVEKTQNTFFHIFNHLHQNGKQLIMTCDRPPVMLQGIEERLITRFKWGLTAEIERPNLDLRRNILADKVRREGISVTPNVLEYIAENVTDSVRELEGILISLMAHSTIYGRDIDLAMAERVISKAVRVNEKEITVEDIVHSTCEYYHIKDESIYSSSRKRDIVLARQIAMYLTHKHLPNLSLARIGQQIGSKDHSTVLHACRTIEEQLEVDKAIEGAIEDIEVKIKSR